MDAAAAGLEVDAAGGLGPGALLAQLGQRRAPGRLQQVVLGGGVGRGGVGDGRRLLGRQLAPAGGGRGLGQGLQPAGGVEGGAAWTTVVPVRRASWWAAERSPSARHEPVSATRAAARALTVAAIFSIRDACSDHLLGLGRRQHGRVEAGGVLTQRFPQLCDPHAHSRANRPRTSDLQGEVEPVTTELVFVSYHLHTSNASTPRTVAARDYRRYARSMTTSTSVPFSVPRPPRPRPAGASVACGRWRRTAACGGPSTRPTPAVAATLVLFATVVYDRFVVGPDHTRRSGFGPSRRPGPGWSWLPSASSCWPTRSTSPTAAPWRTAVSGSPT